MSKRKIIVGVDNSPASHRALHWAAEEADRTGRELVILNAYDWHVAGARFQVSGGYADDLRQAAEGVVSSSARDAEAHAPGVRASAETAVGSPGRVLADAATTDDLIVVGNRGRGGFASLLLGSVSHYVATRAKAPVAVVRGRPDPGSGPRPESGSGPVVVGVDTAHGDNALRIAFEEANLRGANLVAVHAYLPAEAVVAYGVLPPIWDQEERLLQEQTAIKEAVAVWAEKYPDVTVEIAAVVGHPVEVLVGLSKTAQLVVVGHHGGGLGEMYLGGVSSGLLHHGESTVIIARDPERHAS